MGKTKTKIIDDSITQDSKKSNQDNLVASLNKQLGIPETAKAKLQEKKQKKLETKPSEEILKKQRGKKYQKALGLVDRNRKYPLTEALDLIQKTSYTKFEGSVEMHINSTVKNLRGFISLPFSVKSRKLTILAFGKNAEQSEADIVGNEETIESLLKGQVGKNKSLSFDIILTTPEWMPMLAKVAKFLGPRGLMPSPKNGTITNDLKKAVAEIQKGKVEYKTDLNSQVMHLLVGKVNQPKDEITMNIKTLYSSIGKSKISKITLSASMGPGIKIDLASI